MKKSSLTKIVGGLFALVAVVLTAMNMQKEPHSNSQIKAIEREEIAKIPRVRKPSKPVSQEVVVVEYSTRAFLKEK